MLGQQRRVGALVRLEPAAVHDGRRLGEGRPRGVHAPLPRRPRLPHRGAHQLVPGLPDERQRPRGDPDPETGTLWTIRYHLIDEATGQPDPRRDDHRRDDAAGDDPRRHGGRGPSRRRALRGARRAAGPDPVRRARRPDHRRPGRRAGVRDRRGQDHAGPRPRRLRDRPPPRPADDRRPRRRRGHHRNGHAATTASTATRPGRGSSPTSTARGDLVGEQAHEMLIGRCERSNDVIEPRLKTQWFIRTGPLAAAGARRDAERPDPDRPGALREGLGALADEHPRLERLPPAVVGPSDPGLVLPGRPLTVTAEPAGPEACEACGRPAGRAHARTRTSSTPGSAPASGRSRRSAGRTRRDDLAALLPDIGHGDGLRHHLLLGRPDDDARHPPDRRRARSTRSTCRASSGTRTA